MVQSNLNTIPETDPGYGQLFAILIRRRYWILSVFCIALALATVQAAREKPTYKSSLQLLVEPNYQSKNTQGGQGGNEKQLVDPTIQVDSATQLNVMQSSKLLQKAIDLMRPQYPDLTVKGLRSSLTVAQLEAGKGAETKTKIFEATYTSNDATKTQKVLKALQQVYQDYNRDQQKQRLAKGLAFIDNELPNVRQSVAKSEADLEQFRKNQNLIDPEEQAKALSESLNNVTQERRANQAQYQDALARYSTLEQQVAKSPTEAIASSRLSQSTRYQQLLGEIQKTELAIAKERMRFTDNNPVLEKLVFQRQEQLTLLEEEGQRSLGGDSSQLNSSRGGLLEKGQLGTTDLALVNQLLEVQKNILGLRAREQILAQKEQQLRAELARLPGILAQYNRLQPDVKLNRNTLEQLEKARQELSIEIARGSFDWEVVEEPQPGEKTGPKKLQSILLGAVVGLMLGGLAAFIREMTDDSVRTSDDLKKQVALPLLGMTPVLPKSQKHSSDLHLPFGKPQVLEPAFSQPIIKLPFGKPQILAPWTIEVIHWPPSWESLDLIYKNIQLLNAVSTIKSLMVTSALPGEGKSTLALGLAISAARLHQRVLLIDADLRNPTLHEKLNLPNDCGLSTLLSSDTTLPIQQSFHSSSSYIDVLTSGPLPADPVNLLSSPRMGELIAGFEKTYDLVLLDATPVIGMVDAMITASFCRGVVLVARIGQVTRHELTEATTMLKKLNILGVVANGAGSTNGYVPKVALK
jgi:capsular exopolysaccharide synthesis family protein